jgi:hypothetical protein
MAVVRQALLGILFLMLAPGSLAARSGPAAGAVSSPGGAGSGCVFAASVLGGLTGGFVGGAAGVLIERAFYPSNPDAGLTGFAVGMLVGVMGGMQLARKVCDEPTEHELRARLQPGSRWGVVSAGVDDPVRLCPARDPTVHATGRLPVWAWLPDSLARAEACARRASPWP